MKSYLKVLLAGVLSIYLTGCTGLLTVEQAAPEISIKPSKEPMVIAILDQRPYVLNRDKLPTFEGLIRSDFGRPSNSYTPTKETLSTYLGKRVEHGFKVKGRDTELLETNLDTTQKGLISKVRKSGKKALVIALREWKFDHHTFSKAAYYDVELAVFDKKGKTLVTKKFNGKDGIPSSPALYNELQLIYKARFEKMFSDPKVRRALEK